jgi:putative tryptophan/tyrosine transport system substrate-binding protein
VRRRRFIALVGGAALAWSTSVRAQQPGGVYRIGLLGTAAPGGPGERLFGGLLGGLQELGYVEGRNLIIERRYPTDGKLERLPELVAELVHLNVDVIVATGSLTPHAAKQTTTRVPIVITNHGDPIGSGLIDGLASPGGNITGLSLLATELVTKQLEILKEVIPGLQRVAVLWNPTSQTHPRMQAEEEAAARALGLQLQRVPAGVADDYEQAFAAITEGGASAVLVLGDPIFWNHQARIVKLATEVRLPAMFPQSEYIGAGGLMSYGASVGESFRRAAIYVDKILKGAKPADLPVEQPTKFELVINLRTAKALGITIPPTLLARADEVIE